MSKKRNPAQRAKQKDYTVEPAPKLHGVITDKMVDGQVEQSGVYPFTFSSSLIIMGAGIVGGVVVPACVEAMGVDARLWTVAALSVLVSLALAFTRYFVDSRRGICRGFWVTLAVSFVALVVVLWLLFYRGVVV